MRCFRSRFVSHTNRMSALFSRPPLLTAMVESGVAEAVALSEAPSHLKGACYPASLDSCMNVLVLVGLKKAAQRQPFVKQVVVAGWAELKTASALRVM